MKKIIALILATFMLVGMLAGCGQDIEKSTDKETKGTNEVKDENKNENDYENGNKNEAQDNQQQISAAVGDILDAPEVSFDTSIEDLYIYFTYPGETENEVLSMEIALDQITEDSYVLYVTNGLLKLDEIVYEVTGDSIAKYYCDVFMDKFQQDDNLTQAELEQELTSIMELLTMFMVAHPDLQGMNFRKTNEGTFAVAGEVYTYDLLESGEVWGKICIDKATGLMVSLKDAQGNSSYTVQKLQTSNVEIPAYK